MTVGELANVVRFQVNNNDVAKVNNTIQSISNTAKKLLGVIGIGISLTQLNALAEEFDGIGDRIAYAAGEAENLDEIQKRILASANNSRSAYGSFAQTVTSLKQANGDLFPLEEAAVFVEYTTKLGKAAGYSDGEISTMQNSLQRIVASGTAGAADITRILRMTPALAEQLARSLNTDVQGLQQMAAQGRLTAQTIKEAMLNSAGDIDSAYAKLNFGVGDALLQIRNKFGFWIDETNKMFDITQSIAKFMTQAFDRILNGLTKIRNAVQWVADKVGGVQNLLRLVALIGGGIYLAMNFSKITGALNGILKLITSIRLRTLLLVGVIVLLALLIDDFINFMQGNNSLLGEFFKKMGIDADEAREDIRKAFTKVKDFLIMVWGGIKEFLIATWKIIKAVATEIFNHLKEFWQKNGERIKTLFINVWNLIWDVLKGIWTLMSTVAHAVFGALKDFWEKNGESIKETFFFVWDAIAETIISIWEIIYGIAKEIFDKIKTYFTDNAEAIKEKYGAIWEKLSGYLTSLWNVISQVAHIVFGGIRDFFAENGGLIKDTFVAIWDAIVAILKPVWDFICNLAMKVFGALQAFWDKWGGTIVNLFQAVWNIIAGIFKAVFEVIKGIFNVFAGLFTGDWEKLWDGIKSIFVGIWDAIVAIFTNIWDVIKDVVLVAVGIIETAITIVWEAIKGVFETVWGWICNFFKAIWDGICAAVNAAVNAISNAITTAWNAVKNFFTTIWNGISSFFSGIWDGMKNMVSNVANGISSVVSNVFNGIKNTVSNIKNAIVNGFQSAIDWIKGLPSQALTWGSDIINNIAQGIRNAIGKVTEAVSSVANKIKSFLHFSVPDEGPLKDFPSYMPDMIDLLVSGMNAGRGLLSDASQALAGVVSDGMLDGMAALRYAASPQARTVSAVSNGGNVSKSIVQNNNFSNTFNGDKAIQKHAANTMERSASDVTSQLARGLAFSL